MTAVAEWVTTAGWTRDHLMRAGVPGTTCCGNRTRRPVRPGAGLRCRICEQTLNEFWVAPTDAQAAEWARDRTP